VTNDEIRMMTLKQIANRTYVRMKNDEILLDDIEDFILFPDSGKREDNIIVDGPCDERIIK
jgi:hypothetical protein